MSECTEQERTFLDVLYREYKLWIEELEFGKDILGDDEVRPKDGLIAFTDDPGVEVRQLMALLLLKRGS